MTGNTIMTAKNSFSEGLLMDFAPDNTQANCMTSALNATLLTFNGNEMSLQNDMGNARVETAYLPDGYVPVGTCEFGDIIYVVSHNPILNKTLIGCFPSPERNISSEELHNPGVSLTSSDFLVLDDSGEPTGELKNSSVKKILFNNDLHPGDKYVIYSKNLDTKYITDYDNDYCTHGTIPRFVKINIVSIEESGKINYLNSNVKWYNNNYYINELAENGDMKSDIDSYRSLVNSAYNTFSSKVSGKLALLIELEKITGFNCTWECYNAPKNLLCWSKVNETDLYTIATTKYYNSVKNKLCFTETESVDDVCKKQLSNSWEFDRGSDFENKRILAVWKNTVSVNVNKQRIYDPSKFYISSSSIIDRINFKDSLNIFLTTHLLQGGSTYGIYINTEKTINIQDENYRIFIPCYTTNRTPITYYESESLVNFVNDESQNKTAEEYLEYCLNTFLNNTENINDSGYDLVLIGIEGKTIYNNSTMVEFTKSTDIAIKQPIMQLEDSSYFIRLSKYDTIQSEFEQDGVIYKPNHLYLNFNWDNDDNCINPSVLEITNENWEYDRDFIKDIKPKFILNRTYKPEEGLYDEKGVLYDHPQAIYNDKIKDFNNITIKSRKHKYNGSPEENYYLLSDDSEPQINDDIVNNYFKYPITKFLGTVSIPVRKINEDGVLEELYSKIIYNYEITPGMPYGRLRDLTVKGYIDFSKIGKDSFDINTWKYYIYNDSFNLTYGLDAYTEPNKKVQELVIEFYDNLGLAAAYHSKGLHSYNGLFSETFKLGNPDSNLNNISNTGEVFLHFTHCVLLKDLKKEENITYYIKNDENEYVELTSESDPNTNVYYGDDAGILYNNWLYLVKLYIKTSYTASDGSTVGDIVNSLTLERWLWTTDMFNKHYYNVKDFKELNPELTLDVEGYYSPTDNWKFNEFVYENNLDSINNANQGLSAKVIHINQNSNDPNVALTIKAGLVNNYNLFNLNADSALDAIKIDIIEGKQYLKNYSELPEIEFYYNDWVKLNTIYPVISDNFLKIDVTKTSDKFAKLLKSDETGLGSELYANNTNAYKDSASLIVKDSSWETVLEKYLKYDEILGKSLLTLLQTFEMEDFIPTNPDNSNENSGDLENPNLEYLILNYFFLYKEMIVSDNILENPLENPLEDIKNEVENYMLNPDNFSPTWFFTKNLEDITENDVKYYHIVKVDHGIYQGKWENSNPEKWNSNTPFISFLNGVTEVVLSSNILQFYNEESTSAIPKQFFRISSPVYSTLGPASYKVVTYDDELNTDPKFYSESEYSELNLNNQRVVVYYAPWEGEIGKYTYQVIKVNPSVYNEILDLYKIGGLTSGIYKINCSIPLIVEGCTKLNDGTYQINESDLVLIYTIGDDSDIYVTIYKKAEVNNTKEDIVYLNLDNEIVELNSPNTYKYSAKLLLDNNIDLEFHAIKFNKYYLKVEDGVAEGVSYLDSLVLNESDLNKYNLTLEYGSDSERVPYFQKALGIGLINKSGVNSEYQKTLYTLEPDDNNYSRCKLDTDKMTRESSASSCDCSMKYTDIIQTDFLKEISSKIFVPITLGYAIDKDNSAKSTVYANGKELKAHSYKNGGTIDLQGSMALLDDGNIKIEDNWIDNNVQVNAQKVISLLTHLFKKGSPKESERKNIRYVSNYAYLKSNYLLYTRDIILKIYLNSNVTLSDKLLFGRNSYLSHINDILFYSDGLSSENDSNVTINGKGAIKNVPFQAKFDYEIGTINTNKGNLYGIEVRSMLSDIVTDQALDLKDNLIYIYDNVNNKFSEFGTVSEIKYDPNQTFSKTLDDSLKTNTSNLSETLDLSNLLHVFDLKNGNLKYTPGNLTNTGNGNNYRINFTKNKGTDIGLTYFDTGLKFFK